MKKHFFMGLAPLFIAALFAVSVLGSLVFALNVYSTVADRDDAAYTYRTASQYIAVKIRQTEDKGAIKTERFGDGDAIVLPSSYDGVEYTTRLYVHNGRLCELFSPVSLEMQPSDGEEILPLGSFDAGIENGMLKIDLCFEDGTNESLSLFLYELKEAK